jgi:phospholipid-transporting ATPase
MLPLRTCVCFWCCCCCCLQGADTVIYERLAHKHPLNAKLKEVTQQHMEDFGSAGLRTLCLAYTELDPDVYDK